MSFAVFFFHVSKGEAEVTLLETRVIFLLVPQQRMIIHFQIEFAHKAHLLMSTNKADYVDYPTGLYFQNETQSFEHNVYLDWSHFGF